MKLPKPLLENDTDVRGADYLPLDVDRLLNSEIIHMTSDAGFRSAVLLWCAAWRQVPAASLPNDDRVLCGMAGLGRDMEKWAEIKSESLHGFILCSDDRFYHPLLVDKAKRLARVRAVNVDNSRKRWKHKTKTNDAGASISQSDRTSGRNATAVPSDMRSQCKLNSKLENNQPPPLPPPLRKSAKSEPAGKGRGGGVSKKVEGEGEPPASYIVPFTPDFMDRIARREGCSIKLVLRRLHALEADFGYEAMSDAVHSAMDDAAVTRPLAVAKHRLGPRA